MARCRSWFVSVWGKQKDAPRSLGASFAVVWSVLLEGVLDLLARIAAVMAAIIGIPQTAGLLTPGILAAAAGLAILAPVLPFTLEMLALRRMTPTAFGTLMALEPALGAFLGLLVLRQQPSAVQVLGVRLVVLTGAAAQQGGRQAIPT